MKDNEIMMFLGGAVLAVGLLMYIKHSERNLKQTPRPKASSSPIPEKKDLTVDNPVPEELSLSEVSSGVFFGKSRKNQYGYIGKPEKMDGHILVVGGPGSGKTSAIANPTAKTWKGSSCTLLIKGDYTERIRQLREAGRNVVVFNPSKLEMNMVRYDPFRILDHYPADRVENAFAIAETLVPLSPDAREPIWVKAAQAFLTGVILHFHALGCSFCETMQAISVHPPRAVISDIMESGNNAAITFISRLAGVEDKLLTSTSFELVPLSFLQSPQMLAAFTEEAECTTLDWEVLTIRQSP